MKRDFIHDAFSSFVFWFENRLLTNGEAFQNVSGQLYKTNDSDYPTSTIFAGPYKQWVYDSSVPNAQIPSGVYYNNVFKPRGTSGLSLDFQNGRAIFSSGVKNGTVNAGFAIKDFNIYTSSKSDYELLIETSYAVNPNLKSSPTGLAADTVVAPCIFLKLKSFNNEEFAFGGMQEATLNFRAVILSDDDFKLNGVGNIFTDLKDKSFLVMSPTPLNRFNDIKSGYYNYLQTSVDNFSFSNLALLDRITFSRLNLSAGNSDAFVLEKFSDLHVGFLDFSIKFQKHPT